MKIFDMERVRNVLVSAVLMSMIVGLRADDQLWYNGAIVYQIYPRSFQDSNGDGIGDLKGILQRVDYLQSLGVDAVWLNPIYPSPNKDYGYDISDFVGIHPEMGTMKDFEDLLAALKAKGIKLILDFVPNHTSDKHDWFDKSSKKVSGYEDYYVWHDPKRDNQGNILPPNNWTGAFRGSMWKYNEDRKQMYLHQYLAEQPDLNYRSPKVISEMETVLKFWLTKGVEGFRMDTVSTLVENDSWQDEPYLSACGDPNDPACYIHTYTTEQELTHEVLRQFKSTLKQFSDDTNTVPKLMITESWSNDPSLLRKYYGLQVAQETTFPFNFLCIMRMSLNNNAKDWADTLNVWYKDVVPGTWATPNLVLGNHDQHRFASRLTEEYTDILNMVQLSLNGTAVVYYGDEIGLLDSEVRRDEGKDIQGLRAPDGQFFSKSRDPARGPLPWSATSNGGFTTGDPWLPLASDYLVKNVDNEQKAEVSHLKVFQALAKLRKSPTFMKGTCDITYTQNALVVIRALLDHPTIITVVNLDNLESEVNLLTLRSSMSNKMKVEVASVNYLDSERVVETGKVVLPPLSGLVLSSL